MGRPKIGPGARERNKAANQPLPMNSRVLLKRLIKNGKLTIGHTTLCFGPSATARKHISDCTPSQADGLVKRGYAVISRPDRSKPRIVTPLPAAFKVALSLILCLLVCSCSANGVSNAPPAVTTVSESDSGPFEYQVITVKAGNATHHVLVTQSRRGLSTTKLCTTFEYDGKPYFVDIDGDIYEWTSIDRKRE